MRRETMIRTVLGPIMLAFSAVFGTAVTPATANAQSISVDEARAIAKEAYISPEALDGKWKAPPLVQAAAVKTSSLTGDVPVTADNFPRAESDLYFGNIVKDGVSASSSIAENQRPSTSRPSSDSIATRYIRRRSSTSTLVRS